MLRTTMSLLLCAMLIGHAHAQTDEGRLYTGKMGAQRVHACIHGDEGKFYIADPVVARGGRSEQGKASDQKPQPYKTWNMVRRQTAQADALSGTWLMADYSTCCLPSPSEAAAKDELFDSMHITAQSSNSWSGKFPITTIDGKKPKKVLKIEWSTTGQDCSGFEDQRLQQPWKVIKETPAEDAHKPAAVAIRTLRHPATAVVKTELLANKAVSAAVAKTVNSKLAELADQMNSDWLSCRGYDGEIRLIEDSSRVAVFEVTNESSCGGAHPNEEATPYSFDLATGEPIQLSQWLQPVSAKEGEWLAPELWKKLLHELNEQLGDNQPECVERMQETRAFEPWMAAAGVQFRFNESVRYLIACRGDYILPYKTVRPFVRAEKRKAFDAIAASFRGRETR